MWPDSRLGWVQLTAKGGHAGNDHRHAAIRRWTANAPGTISIKSEIFHQEAAGDGIRCWIVASEGGVLASATVYNERKQLDVDTLAVKPGDTVDFVVDYGKSLNSDMFVWIPSITQARSPGCGRHTVESSDDHVELRQRFPSRSAITLGTIHATAARLQRTHVCGLNEYGKQRIQFANR